MPQRCRACIQARVCHARYNCVLSIWLNEWLQFLDQIHISIIILFSTRFRESLVNCWFPIRLCPALLQTDQSISQSIKFEIWNIRHWVMLWYPSVPLIVLSSMYVKYLYIFMCMTKCILLSVILFSCDWHPYNCFYPNPLFKRIVICMVHIE